MGTERRFRVHGLKIAGFTLSVVSLGITFNVYHSITRRNERTYHFSHKSKKTTGLMRGSSCFRVAELKGRVQPWI